jgi:hypothetical protein
MTTFHAPIVSAFVTALAVVVGTAARAESPFMGGTWTLLLENDRLADTDRHYSHGTRIAWVSDKQTGGPDWMRHALDFLYPFAPVRAGRIGFALGQNIYTPEDISRSDLIRDDRPYAGWLYVGGSVHAETKQTLAGRPFDILDTVEIDLGMVGPASLAEPTQKFVHELIDTTRPRGWRHQLDNEPGLVIIGERKWRTPPAALGPIHADMIPHLGGALGNVFTHINAGSTFRIGQNLWLDYGPPHIQPALSGLEAVDATGAFGWYLFAGVEGRAIGRNIFLDGNTFSDSHSVDKRAFVGDFLLGAAIIYRGARLAFTHVYRTREFDGQREPDSFAAVSLSMKF